MSTADPPILILAASAGAGHVSAARALADEFRRQRPGVAVEALDVLAYTNPLFRALYAGGYHALERCAATTLGWIYDAADHVQQRGGWRAAFQDLNAGPFRRLLGARRPRLIVNTHFLAAELVARLRRRGLLDCPQVTVLTDFEVHRLWVQPPTEHYFVACPLARDHLQACGVSAERISLTGIPVRAAFGQREAAGALRRRLNVRPEARLVLLLCGGWNAALCPRLLDELARLPGDTCVVAITGRNRAALRGLERFAAGLPGEEGRIRVLGFTDRMADWLRAADVVVTKPGGLTCAEALAAGVPLVLVAPIPGQEARNSDVLLEYGAALKVNHPRVLSARVAELLTQPGQRAALAAAAARLGRPAAAADIVRAALDLLDRPRPENAAPSVAPRVERI